MPDTPTPKLGLLRPRLGKKPWKKEWDFNMALLDTQLGGLLDGSVPAHTALGVDPTGITSNVVEIVGDCGIASVGDASSLDIDVDHSSTMIFSMPSDPIFTSIAGVEVFPLLGRAGLTGTDYGGKFRVRVENNSGGTITGSQLTWRRRGFI